MRVAIRSRVPAADYLAWEREQPEKHEYLDGEVYAMAGGSPRHNALCARVIAGLSASLPRRDCFVLTSDQRLGRTGARYVYPDVTVVCGHVPDSPHDVVPDASIIVEVLSSSTEDHDRGKKWETYRRLPSLTDYLLVSQHDVRVEHFQRAENGAWLYRVDGPGDFVDLATGARLAVDDLFDGVFTLPGDVAPSAP